MCNEELTKLKKIRKRLQEELAELDETQERLQEKIEEEMEADAEQVDWSMDL